MLNVCREERTGQSPMRIVVKCLQIKWHISKLVAVVPRIIRGMMGDANR